MICKKKNNNNILIIILISGSYKVLFFFLIHVKLFGLIQSKMLKQQQQKQNVKWTSLFACYTVLLGVIWSLLLEFPKFTPQSTPGYIYTKPSTESPQSPLKPYISF